MNTPGASRDRSVPWAAFLVVFGMLAYAVSVGWFSIARAHNFNAGWYDLGIMTQTVWRVGHGYGFTFTNPEAGPGGMHGWTSPRTAIHTDYLLALLAPLSWTGWTMEALLILQAAAVAAGGWFVFRLARRLLHSSRLGALWAWVYLLYPPLQFANLFEFHAVTLAVTFSLAAADAIVHRRHRAFWIWAALALLAKEQVGITLGLLSAAVYWWTGERRRAVWAGLIPWAWSAIQLLVVIPGSRPNLPSSFVYQKFYASVGDSAGSIIRQLLDPRTVWERLVTRTHLHNLVMLLTPLGYVLPLFSVLTLAILPEALLYWLSDSPNQQTLFLHYHALFIPPLFLGAIFGWRWIRQRLAHFGSAAVRVANLTLSLLLIAGTVQAVVQFSPWPWSPITRWPLVGWRERLGPQVRKALAMIPARASLGTTQNLGPLVAQRPVVQLLPNGLRQVDYLLILERKFDPNIPTNDKRVAEQTMLKLLIDWVEVSPAYQRIYAFERVHLYQRIGQPTAPEPSWPDNLLGR